MISVIRPIWTATAIGGYMEVNTNFPPMQGNYSLWAGPIPASGQYGGINWGLEVDTPSPFASGTTQLVQIVTPHMSYVTSNPTTTHNFLDNNMAGLDTECPYAGLQGSGVKATLIPNDSPSISLIYSGVQAYSASMTHNFTDHLMYLPPGTGSMWVELAKSTWSTNGNATIPNTGFWSDYATLHGSNSAGEVNANPFVKYNTFPTWTRVNKVSDGFN